MMWWLSCTILILSSSFFFCCSESATLSQTPPMGWMSWEIFRCNTDCQSDPDTCIGETLYKRQTDALISGGFLSAGYDTIHIDDCWQQKTPPRVNGTLVADPDRFPNGMKFLGDFMHERNVHFGLYSAESNFTCGGYPASQGYESVDADTFAEWGVDYMKVDGCGEPSYYQTGYMLMGDSLQSSGRPIVYSCSWPAYLGSNETTKTSCYKDMIQDGCNLWRNWDDIQCHWNSLVSIIDHYGDYSKYLAQWVSPGHWNDPDMLLIGNDCIEDTEARTQMAIWSILAGPLIMGNDLTQLVASHIPILLNPEAIAVNQDPMGVAGIRISPKGDQEVWARTLSKGDMAVALFNKFSSSGDSENITVLFSSIGLNPNAKYQVRDIWKREIVGVFIGSYTAYNVSEHDTSLIRISPYFAS